jgi:hypothetical protein
MGVGNQPKHGTLEHLKLRIGNEVLANGEKTRPNYLGTTVDLSNGAGSSQSQVSSRKSAENNQSKS